jgi:hypothetical protein
MFRAILESPLQGVRELGNWGIFGRFSNRLYRGLGNWGIGELGNVRAILESPLQGIGWGIGELGNWGIFGRFSNRLYRGLERGVWGEGLRNDRREAISGYYGQDLPAICCYF